MQTTSRQLANGATVLVSNADVRRFRQSWPCSGINAKARFRFEFDSRGDLVDLWCSHRYEDGSAIIALCDDALRFVVFQMPNAHGHRDRLGTPMRNMRDFDRL